MIHYGIAFLLTWAVIALAFYKLNKLRWLIGLGAAFYLISFLMFQLTISLGHNYGLTGKSYDYILVFGGGLKGNYEVRDAVAVRLDQALAAGANGDASFIVSGGLGTDRQPDEAEAMADYLKARGVSGERIILEDRSTSTWENLVFTQQLMGKANLDHAKVLGVSSDFHLQRIAFLAERLDMTMDLLPAKTPWYDRLHSMPREYFATIKSLIFDRVDKDGDLILIGVHGAEVEGVSAPNHISDYRINHDHGVAEVSLLAVGDIMVHRSQLIRGDGQEGFDFGPSFRWVAPYIQEADYAIGNLETTFAGENGQRRLNVDKFYKGYSGYPVFNTPDIMADNLKDAGFDMLLTANNHSLDSKEEGLIRTLEVLDDRGFDHVGTYASDEEAREKFILELDGITFGIINYTYAMNGFWLSEEDDHMINHLGNYDEAGIEAMYEDVKDMADEEPDFVVVALHYGIEYLTEPDTYIQQPLIDGLFGSGADIILGGHPHVLQPFEVRELIREDGKMETGVVIYSLGNFISSQRNRYTAKDTDYGLMFSLNCRKIDDGPATIDCIRLMPTYVHWTSEDLEILPILSVPEEVTLTAEDKARLTRGEEDIIPHLMSYWDGEWQVASEEIIVNLD